MQLPRNLTHSSLQTSHQPVMSFLGSMGVRLPVSSGDEECRHLQTSTRFARLELAGSRVHREGTEQV